MALLLHPRPSSRAVLDCRHYRVQASPTSISRGNTWPLSSKSFFGGFKPAPPALDRCHFHWNAGSHIVSTASNPSPAPERCCLHHAGKAYTRFFVSSQCPEPLAHLGECVGDDAAPFQASTPTPQQPLDTVSHTGCHTVSSQWPGLIPQQREGNHFQWNMPNSFNQASTAAIAACFPPALTVSPILPETTDYRKKNLRKTEGFKP